MFEDNWFNWAILSATCFGIYSFFYKRAAEEKADVITIQIVMPSTVIILSVLLLSTTNLPIGDNIPFIAGVAFLQGILFYLTTVTRLKSFEYDIPSHIVFPIIKSSTILIVLISALIFNEFNNLYEPKRATGIFLAILATYLLLPGNRNLNKLSRIGLIFAVAAMFSSAGASISSKYLFSVSELNNAEVNIFGFILFSNIVTLFLSFGNMYASSSKSKRYDFNHGLSWGIIMGVLNFIGFSAFLQAIKYGDLSLVATINALYILIPIVLSAIVYKEKLNVTSKFAVILSILAIILIK